MIISFNFIFFSGVFEMLLLILLYNFLIWLSTLSLLGTPSKYFICISSQRFYYFNLLLRVEFQWFLIELSDLPGNKLAIKDHRFPNLIIYRYLFPTSNVIQLFSNLPIQSNDPSKFLDPNDYEIYAYYLLINTSLDIIFQFVQEVYSQYNSNF